MRTGSGRASRWARTNESHWTRSDRWRDLTAEPSQMPRLVSRRGDDRQGLAGRRRRVRPDRRRVLITDGDRADEPAERDDPSGLAVAGRDAHVATSCGPDRA